MYHISQCFIESLSIQSSTSISFCSFYLISCFFGLTGESVMTGVDSWTHCESMCKLALAERSISETNGWTVSIDNSECSGLDYIFDSISAMELPPAFPVLQKNMPVIMSKVFLFKISTNFSIVSLRNFNPCCVYLLGPRTNTCG